MLRAILTAGIVCLIADSASAQYPTQPFPGSTGTYNYGGYGYGTPYGPTINTQNFMPNIFNPQNQPLSPYLNMFRGNPSVNYFFGVRPGTLGMGNRNYGGAPFMAFGGNRMLFFPQLASAPE
ncbi:MAG TPA: hypothetical protein VLM40_09300, partial [Gemmata sp.]|nr:hypothetical protein [Gemmata sp.]